MQISTRFPALEKERYLELNTSLVPTMLNFQNFVKTCVFWSFLLVFCSKSKLPQHAKFPEFCQNMCFFTFLNKKDVFSRISFRAILLYKPVFFRDFQKKIKNKTLIYSRENYFLRSKMCQKKTCFLVYFRSPLVGISFFCFFVFFSTTDS